MTEIPLMFNSVVLIKNDLFRGMNFFEIKEILKWKNGEDDKRVRGCSLIDSGWKQELAFI